MSGAPQAQLYLYPSCGWPWQVSVHEPPLVAPGVHESVPEVAPSGTNGWTFGAKLTRRDPGITCEPTLFVVEWIRKWHSAQMALPCPSPALSMSVPPSPLPSDVRCFAWRLKLSLIHISEPTRLGMISYAVF